jgi:hypothetical protein
MLIPGLHSLYIHIKLHTHIYIYINMEQAKQTQKANEIRLGISKHGC